MALLIKLKNIPATQSLIQQITMITLLSIRPFCLRPTADPIKTYKKLIGRDTLGNHLFVLLIFNQSKVFFALMVSHGLNHWTTLFLNYWVLLRFNLRQYQYNLNARPAINNVALLFLSKLQFHCLVIGIGTFLVYHSASRTFLQKHSFSLNPRMTVFPFSSKTHKSSQRRLNEKRIGPDFTVTFSTEAG